MNNRQLTEAEKNDLLTNYLDPSVFLLTDFLKSGGLKVGDWKEVTGKIPASDGGELTLTMTIKIDA